MISDSIKKRILILIAILALLFSGISMVSNSYGQASAGEACRELGYGLDKKSSVGGVFQGTSNEDSPNRKWTAEELFRNSVGFTTYYGEGQATWWYADTSGRGEGYDGYEEIKSKLEESRGCVTFDFIPNSFFFFSSMITGVIASITLKLVGKDYMAETLMNIVGGERDSSDGLISIFLESFYMPLVVITVVIMAFVIVYKGLIQFKFREALNSLLWTFGAFVLGVALMLNPQILVSVPQTATSTITSCVMGALSGQNCLTGSVEAPSALTGPECASSVGSEGNDAESAVNSLNCTVWKSFVLDPWAEVQFGAPYNELYTKNAPKGGEYWRNLPEGQGDKYCVNLTSSKSYADSIASGSPVMDGSKEEICNVALYHLFVKTDMKDPTSQSGNNIDDGWTVDDTGSYDKRWYDIIVPAAGDSSTWRSWSGDGQLGSRMGAGFLGIVASGAAATVLLLLAVFAGAYKVIGLVLMAFAPVFLLLAIEPTRGRRIFLGWLETLISSILKYFAITVLIVVSLVMYAGMLTSASSVMAFVGVIILTAAIHMYRKEIVNLIGASNMGGQRLTNKANEFGSKAANKLKKGTSATTGGALGGAVGRLAERSAALNSRNETIEDLQRKLNAATSEEDKEFYSEQIANEKALKSEEGSLAGTFMKGAFQGSTDSVKRAMKRGTGIGANIMQQSDRTKNALEAERTKRQNEAEKMRQGYETERARAEALAAEDLAEEGFVPVNKDGEIVDPELLQESIDLKYKEIPEPRYTKNEDLSQEEKKELDEIVKKVKQEGYSDEELLEMIKSEEFLENSDKQEIVSNEIKARIEAYNDLEVSGSPIQEATAVEKGLVESPELASALNNFEAEFINTFSAESHEDMLKAYGDIMYETGLSKEIVAASTASMIAAYNTNLEKSKGRIKSEIDEVDDKLFNKAKKRILEDGEVDREKLKEEFEIDDKTADNIIDLMEIEQKVEAPSDNEEEREANYRRVIKKDSEENRYSEEEKEREEKEENEEDKEDEAPEIKERYESREERFDEGPLPDIEEFEDEAPELEERPEPRKNEEPEPRKDEEPEPRKNEEPEPRKDERPEPRKNEEPEPEGDPFEDMYQDMLDEMNEDFEEETEGKDNDPIEDMYNDILEEMNDRRNRDDD